MAQQLDQLLAAKPQVATLDLPSIKINLDGDTPFAQIHGLNAVIDPKAQENIIKIAGLDGKSLQTIQSTAGKVAAQTILRQAMKAIGNKKLTFAFDGPRITRVVDPGNKALAMSNTAVSNLAEMMLAKGMQIWGMQMSPDATSAHIQILNPAIHEHPTKKDESVSIGRTIKWDALGGTSIADFVQRMFCSNGSTHNEDGRIISILRPDMDPAQIYQMLFIEGQEKFLTTHFNRINKLSDTLMSVREWNQLSGKLLEFNKDHSVIKDHLGFAPKPGGRFPFEDEYAKKGHDLDKYTQDQLANCPTPVYWWDAVNALTYLASHPTNTDVGDWRKGQLINEAGKLINRSKRDADAWMMALPNFN